LGRQVSTRLEKMTKAHGESLAELDGAELFRLGSEALNAKNYAKAHRYLQAALERERTPDHLSQFALALAAHTREIEQSILLCQEAVKKEPKNSEHFLRLGTVYLVAGRKKEAIRIFRLGLRVGNNPTIVRWLHALGDRKKPPIPFLARTNPLNKILGRIRMKLAGKK
jgi:tetratricopeptide (TPR) repeat protein